MLVSLTAKIFHLQSFGWMGKVWYSGLYLVVLETTAIHVHNQLLTPHHHDNKSGAHLLIVNDKKNLEENTINIEIFRRGEIFVLIAGRINPQN